MRMADMPDPGVAVQLPFTDVAALGDDKFALTAIGNGFLLDLLLQRLTLHFCYEPGDFPEDQRQATSAVTYDLEDNRLYAQPQTFLSGVEDPSASQIGAFEGTSGFDLQWYDLPRPDFRAGGMAIAPDGGILLGAGSTLYRFDPVAGFLATADDLGRYGVGQIEGLATDPIAGTLLAIDASNDQLVEIRLADLDI